MLNIEAIESAEQLKKEADEVLVRTQLIEIIARHFANYTFIGSYACKTMVWPDIDISVRLQNEAFEGFAKMTWEIMNIPNIYKLIYKNEFLEVAKNKRAFYIGIYYFDENMVNKQWKIDIKGVFRKEYDECVDTIKRKKEELTASQRSLIIEAKKAVCVEMEGFYRPPKSMSHKIHQIVVQNDYDNFKEILEEAYTDD